MRLRARAVAGCPALVSAGARDGRCEPCPAATGCPGHAATALEHGFTEIVTTDRDFDAVPGLARLDPEAW